MIHERRDPPSHSRGDGSGRPACCSHQVDGSSNCICRLQTCTNEAEKRITVCYFTNWAWYRSGFGKFTLENMNASLCTNINYAFASLDSEITIRLFDPWTDIDNKFYQLLVILIAKGVKVLLSIGGGWFNSAASVGWSRMFNNATARVVFVKSVVEFIEHYNFSGLNVVYEYPACPQGNRSAGSPTDIENFNKLISELKDAFNGKYLLTVMVSTGQANLKECYNISELCYIPDWINVMSYDYHSSSEDVAGGNAPTRGTSSSWGVICLNQKDGWNTGWSKSNDSYASNNTQFVSFDSVIDMKRKSCLINKYFGLKGAMIWALDYDDFTDSCGGGVYPLLKTLNQELRFHMCPV